MEKQTYTNVTIYRDKHMKDSFKRILDDKVEQKYTVEVKGNKARVLNPNSTMFDMKDVSNWNKLNVTFTSSKGLATLKKHCMLVVEGTKVYFELTEYIFCHICDSAYIQTTEQDVKYTCTMCGDEEPTRIENSYSKEKAVDFGNM